MAQIPGHVQREDVVQAILGHENNGNNIQARPEAQTQRVRQAEPGNQQEQEARAGNPIQHQHVAQNPGVVGSLLRSMGMRETSHVLVDVGNDNDMQALLGRLAALENRNRPTVSSLKKGIIQYALRQTSDFDKYEALAKVESLKNVSKDLKDKKADYYANTHAALWPRLSENYRVSKIDKSFKDKESSVRAQAFHPQLPPLQMPSATHGNQFQGQIPPTAFGSFVPHQNVPYLAPYHPGIHGLSVWLPEVFLSPPIKPIGGLTRVNVFAQSFVSEENYYIFPPFVLIGPLLKFLKDSPIRVTFLAFDVSPRKFWWPLINSYAADSCLLGEKGQKDVIFFPPDKKLG
eukprot:gene936-247_t